MPVFFCMGRILLTVKYDLTEGGDEVNRLKELRKERNLLQKDLATRLNISQSTISDYEVHKRVIDLKTAEMFADYFGVSLDYFAGRSRYRNPSPGELVSQKYDELFSMIMQLEPLPLQYVTKFVRAVLSQDDT